MDYSMDDLLLGQLKFLNRKFEVVAVAKDTGLLQKVGLREGVRVVSVDIRRDISILADLRSLWNLYRLFKAERPEIVHSNTPKSSLLSMVAAWLVRTPHRIYTVTGLRFETATGCFRLLLKTMERITCFCATKVIPEGEGVKATLIREQITNKPLQVINQGNINGIDIDKFDPSLEEIQTAAKPLRSDKFTFIFAGRLVKDKGVNELIEAYDRLSKEFRYVRLRLLGRMEKDLDPLPARTVETIRDNQSIIYEGFQNDVRPYMLASQALILPSYREGFPNVVIQAGALGLPCIVTDINGSNEIIRHEVNGLIVPKQDTESLYKAMRRLVSDVSLYDSLAVSTRQLIISRYRCEEVWAALLEMYEELLFNTEETSESQIDINVEVLNDYSSRF
jgi:glycosyltransferase involved in cell wall biosynthesis